MRLFLALLFLSPVAFPQLPTPVITAATPNPIDAGGPAFTLTVTTSGYVSAAIVKWSGVALTTTYVNDTTLTATVPDSLIAICGKYQVTVSSGPAGTPSNPFPVIVRPVLKAVSPASVLAGTNGTGVTAIGLGFSSNVYLTLIASGTRTNLATNHSGSTSLTATIPASALGGAAPSVSLFVTDPTTGAVSETLDITLTFASISAISPSRIPAGFDSFTLQVAGTNFAGGAIVLFDGAPLTTRSAGGGLLLAAVPAALVHDAVPAGVNIQVKNPGTNPTNAIKLVIEPNPFGTQLISLSPDHAVAGGPAVTLTVTGERFVQGSTVYWITTPLATNYVSATQLTATIPASLVTIEGIARINIVTPGLTNSNSLNFPIVAAFPTISTSGNGIVPSSVTAGGPGFTMTVNGDGFVLASNVTGLAGATTTYVSLNQLTVNVPASAIVNPGQFPIRVVNPGNRVSPQAPTFTVKAPTPAITSLSPASVLSGGADFTLTVAGTNFFAGAVVAWNGAALTTTRVSDTRLTAAVQSALIATAGAAKITVLNPGPVASNEVVLPISTSPAASLVSLNPSSALPGGPAFTLTVTGAGFTSASKVQWNGAALVTTPVSATELTALVPASLIAAAGAASITVTGDGAPSNALPFTIALPGPATSTAGIVNAASSVPAIAPGALIAIFGTNLAASTAQFSTTPLPLSLGGTSVTINGDRVPLLYVSPGQVNAQVPYEIKPGTAKLVVQANGVSSSAVNVEVAATGPGVFVQPSGNHVLALNLADGTLNSPQAPARPAQYITAYLTGQGAVNPTVPAGDVGPSTPPFPAPIAPVQVKIGGVIAKIQFAGLAPGFVNGLLQMNIEIPDVPTGELAFEVTVGSVAAAPTVISIAR